MKSIFLALLMLVVSTVSAQTAERIVTVKDVGDVPTWTLVVVYGQVHHSLFEWFGVEPTITNLSTVAIDGYTSQGQCNIAAYDLKSSTGSLSYGNPSKGGGDLRIMLSTACLEVN